MIDDLWLWIILAGLANYKAAHILSQDGEDGPFNLFKRLREKAGTTNWFGKGLHCFSCTSFWGALVAALLLGAGLPINLFLLAWGAIATLSYCVWRYFG